MQDFPELFLERFMHILKKSIEEFIRKSTEKFLQKCLQEFSKENSGEITGATHVRFCKRIFVEISDEVLRENLNF